MEISKSSFIFYKILEQDLQTDFKNYVKNILKYVFQDVFFLIRVSHLNFLLQSNLLLIFHYYPFLFLFQLASRDLTVRLFSKTLRIMVLTI